MASPLINSSMERTTTGGRILNIQSFLPLRPVKHKPTKEEAQAKKEEELRLKKEKEESARWVFLCFSIQIPMQNYFRLIVCLQMNIWDGCRVHQFLELKKI